MDNRLQNLRKEYDRIMNQQEFSPADLDYSLLKKHIEMLQLVDVIETSAISIFDLHQPKPLYLSKRYESVFGWEIEEAHAEGNDYMNRRIHPDDFLSMMEAGNYYMQFAINLPTEEKKNYKLLFDYRIISSGDQYIRVIEQQMALELDKRGNVWLALGLMDISPDQDVDAPVRSRLVNLKTGELFLFPVPSMEENQPLNLSKREKEVLGLIAKGLISKEIADKLFISVNTVNTHRQRIIEKLEVSNSAEAIQYAVMHGLISPH